MFTFSKAFSSTQVVHNFAYFLGLTQRKLAFDFLHLF